MKPRYLIVAVAVAVVVAVLVVFLMWRPRPLEFTGSPVKITAEELSSAYKTDEQVADSRFKGRIVEITGSVMGVEPLWPKTGKLLVMMMNDLSVQCFVTEENRGPFNEVQPNDMLTIRGGCMGNGGRTMLAVHIVNCELVDWVPKSR
jgi:tRNA_anti-like